MQEEKVEEVLTIIVSDVLFLKEQLSSAEASIRYAQLELEALTQTIQNLSTQNDMPVCKCNEKISKEVTCTSGEKTDKAYQLTQDRVKIAQDFWKSFKSEE